MKDSESTAYESNPILLPAGNNSISLVFLSQFPRAATKEGEREKRKKETTKERRRTPSKVQKQPRRNPIKNASPLSTRFCFVVFNFVFGEKCLPTRKRIEHNRNFELSIDNFEDKSRQISRKRLKTRERGTSLVCPSSEARRGESTGRLVV